MLGLGQDVKLLAAIGAVAVANKADLLQYIQRPVDRRRDRLRIFGAAALDQLRRRDVPR